MTRPGPYTDAAIAAPPDAACVSGGRAVTALPGYDPVRAKDPAWRLAFEKDRVRRNAEALAVLNREAREKTQAATGNRMSLAIPSASGTARSAQEHPACDG